MTRALLSILLCGLCAGLGLETARIQSQNHALAAALDLKKRKCDLLEAGNEKWRYAIDVRLAEICFEELHLAGENNTTVDQ